ncbi:hypothetical protein DVK85_12970 [Flavobacterium arcticum]|uniref:Dihydrolipoamide dehydrogenase n=1 Tax=Flavobacterium arcticum TaxID=1784713 RepID=A0A345HET1_9FLAO|nr:hypothetical protein [Flavobacterium arcticum]AXG75091.1 hypothetical protein DVK85_12970 [Flavobacterium arcticum]KAF2511130.1 hypothetical protein E0W72_06975 [Flavobacterium arcticum]
MRKIFLLLSVVGTLAFTSCDNDDDIYVDTDTIGETIQLNSVNLTFDNATGRYQLLYPLDPVIYDSDAVLVYRFVNDDGFIAKQLIPRTLYIGGPDEVDYDFNYTSQDVLIYADANFDLSTAPEFIYNQTFQIIILPSDFSSNIDVNDYDAVMSALNAGGNQEVRVIETR